jgi:hypothetical protein
MGNYPVDQIRNALIYSHALRNKLLPVSIASNLFRGAAAGGVRCKQTSSYEATVVSPEQMISILEHLDETSTQTKWMMALLHGATALRGEEAFGAPVG